ncbi:divalent-cation tolerance protein CutA [Novosphingobium beihaiensis]|uniref:Divalent-cation tolerance protein CutA n=1 Tax=Novosphingobium beihaiensis TaxID=2930389 RepID=A0ABT0BRJ2_9SPHN|nr:divalent-cation tolerance protein CutA [Novosphingobium beihaiensis]MCJ2187488.1 divalent-cation tolerance protein CutA [Novosphingobium beihaiensis]
MGETSGGSGAALIWCPFPDEDAALAAIRVLLGEGLIACGNVLPAMTSMFVWNGGMDTARESGTLLKTNADLLEKAVQRLAELHPYEEPAVLGWHCDTAPPGTLAWLAATGTKL